MNQKLLKIYVFILFATMSQNIALSSQLNVFKRVGPTIINRLKKMGVKTIIDLLFYYPFRYDDFSKITSIAKLNAGEPATIKGRINLIANRRSPVKKMIITEMIISDNTGSIKAVWFNQPFLTKALNAGEQIYLSGQASYYTNTFQITNPSYEKVKGDTLHTARLVPIYPTTEKLTQKQIRWLVKLTLPWASKIKEWLPLEIIKKLNLLSQSSALVQIHFPQNQNFLEKASYRLKFDELFLLQLKSFYLRQELTKQKAPVIKFKEKQTKKFVKDLPFKLTNAQRKVAWEILNDLKKQNPMNRLLEGDVGSGKTVVAAIALLNVFLNKKQSVFMAPTEILAQQHFKTISELFKNHSIKIALLTSSTKQITGSKTKISEPTLVKKISSGEIDIIIGTHALLQEKVKFKSLALTVIDEQHRFGVEQRTTLIKNSHDNSHKFESEFACSPHFLSTTATPIPRSLALTLYGNLDLSIIDEMPPGRKKIITKIISPKERNQAYDFIKKEIKRGRQVFVICPLIDPSDKLGVKSVTTEYEKLNQEIFSDIRVGLLHGKLKSKEKDQIMKDFINKKTKILVSTSVVEVGVDIPNASVMMIEGAERFGLAQLYQLRGRVGRSEHQSHCFIFTESESDKTKKRLNALITAKNGFELAEKDLEIRGPGEIYGIRQSGFMSDLRIARLTDYEIINKAKQIAKEIFQKDPDLKTYPTLKNRINELFKSDHLEWL